MKSLKSWSQWWQMKLSLLTISGDMMLVCEENSLWGNFVSPLLYLWWDVMWLWKWYANLHSFAFEQISLRLKSSNKPYTASIIEVHPSAEHFPNMVNTRQKHVNALSAKWNYATRIDWMLTVNNITQYQWIKGYYQTGFYHLLAGITRSHHGLTTFGAPELPSTSRQLMVYS
jgi:hypothetical protein